MKIETEITIIRDIIFKKIKARIIKENILILKVIKILKFEFKNLLESPLLLGNIYSTKRVIV